MTDSDAMSADLRARSLPLLAVLIGVAVLAVAAIALPNVAPALPRGTLVGAGAGAGLVLWVLALVIGGLRRGPGWWIAASLALLVGSGALAGFNAARIGHAGTAADASTFAELELNPDATPILPSNPVRGPLSSGYVELVRADEREVRAQAANLANLNLGMLNSPYLLSQAPAVLDKCGTIGTLADTAERVSRRRADRVASLASSIAAADLDAAVKQGIMTIATPPEGVPDALVAQERTLWQATQALCELLAKRGWTNANGYFAFARPADKAAFDALNQRRIAVEGERRRLRDRIKQRFEAGREQVRAALS